MPRAGLHPAAVVAAGATLADEVGLAGFTMGQLAERVGVRTPSLYKHVESLDALQHSIGVQAKHELGIALARATVGKAGPETVRAFADCYRRWLPDHPGRYAATVRAPSADEPDYEENCRASNEALQVLLDVLSGFELHGDRIIDGARALRSALHGFVTLDAAGGFGIPHDVDRSFDFLIDSLIAGLQASNSARPT